LKAVAHAPPAGQFIFAGKRIRDEGGRALSQEVYRFSREAGLKSRCVLEVDIYIRARLSGFDLC